MTNTVTFPTNVGGDGSTVTDDSNATTGLANGGFRVRLLPMFTQIIAIANWILGKASAAATSATNAATSETNAGTAATNAGNSSTTAGQWASQLGSQVASTDYSAKAYAVGTGANAPTAGSAKDWATKASGTVDGTGYSASYWAGQAATSAAAAAASSPLPSSTGNSGKFLTNNGTVASWTNTATVKLHLTAMDTASTALGSVSGTVNIDCSAAQAYSFTPTAAVTLAFTNPPAANTSQVILLKVTNGGAFTLSFPAGTKYPGGSLGTLTSSGVDWLGVAYDAGLSAWVVFVLGKAVA